ncbi:carboxymuconolactone decarboxylase family protein [Cytobacillus purgationiresistens]|uniref:Alkylhydroperoxidase/carboxymuconolactone decarboxylase family protein YurZ n=1 Tax=Cytobacillus purgationiresistens TaxID=863449 RepID=A0ABU0ASX1_9BACI|nr:carboxymuconolactone decarboxylase family protein [Cytobacillus purgationiresistens]MDQ0273140.1 alkylhydroperoxidase/carboxymuconolactone decarboxylase family protein YurZ [Cytobacillus purgationiresistens]
MSKGLEYFKNVYDVVPGWVQKMYDYNPKILDHYTNLRGDIMKPGHLSVKEKDILLVGMNAARLYERSMVYHTKGAIDGGASLSELAEYLIVSYLYYGPQALKAGMKSLEYACTLKGFPVQSETKEVEGLEEILKYYIDLLGEGNADFVKSVLSTVQAGDHQAVQEKILSDGVVTTKMKHILMTGIYITVLNGKDAGEWMEKAREKGASEDELAETGYICLLTAGIPAWFEASDSLVEK